LHTQELAAHKQKEGRKSQEDEHRLALPPLSFERGPETLGVLCGDLIEKQVPVREEPSESHANDDRASPQTPEGAGTGRCSGDSLTPQLLSWSSLPTMRNLSRRPSPSSPPASPWCSPARTRGGPAPFLLRSSKNVCQQVPQFADLPPDQFVRAVIPTLGIGVGGDGRRVRGEHVRVPSGRAPGDGAFVCGSGSA